jgi:hypothetical protein
MDYIADRAKGAAQIIAHKYEGCSRAQMARRLRMGNPFGVNCSKRRSDIYARECRRELARLYPNGESGKTLFSEAEDKP